MGIDTNLIYHGDCYSVLKREFPDKCVDLICIDPIFSKKKKYVAFWFDKETQELYEEIRKGGVKHFISWIEKRAREFQRVLKDTGSLYLHCDDVFGDYIKVKLDEIFGPNNFQNSITWCYRGGGVSKKRWARKHDRILFYTKGKEWTFNPQYVPYSEASRKLVESRGGVSVDGKERDLERGAHMPDWWTDINALQTWSPERTGWLTQKPVGLLERIIKASSNPGDIVLDPMCGCGTTLEAAYNLERRWIGIDISSQACGVMKKRMEGLEGITEVEVRGLPLTLRDLERLDPFEFQDYICDMTDSERGRRGADMGIDGYYSDDRIPLQIKQQKRVGRKTVDEFETALRRKRKDKGYIIAFSFSTGKNGAYEEIARAKEDGFDIKLVTLSELVRNDYDLEAFEEV